MSISVREMTLAETPMVMDYFRTSTPEFLETMGVDPTRFPPPREWTERLRQLYDLPIERRWSLFVVWLRDGRPVGFSSCDKITFGEQAHMHLQIFESENRRRGLGVECVRRSVVVYFEKLRLKRLFAEPNAYNVAPNRTLQKAGFKYLKTHKTVPSPINFHQAVTRWVIER